jgi:hypothetical protein
MIDRIEYKLQGAGTDNPFDSWFTYYVDVNIAPLMSMKDPSIKESIDMGAVDLNTMTIEQITQLKQVLGL